MKSERYDAIIIGSGFGGAASAYNLTRAGFKTLLLERGGWAKRDDGDWNEHKILIEKRYRSEPPLSVQQYGRGPEDHHLNEIVGGMSVFYGGASLRLRENDFAQWPLSYEEFEPYYTKAEELLEVHGEARQDSREPPRSAPFPHPTIPLAPPAERIRDAALKVGYRPLTIPLALNFSDGQRRQCIQCATCDGFPCQIEAKNDVTTNLLLLSQRQGLTLMAGIAVDRLVEKEGRIESVECIDRATNRSLSYTAAVVVLAAGAIHSPAILLRSNLQGLPQYGLIGRFLMRHCNAVVSYLFPFRTNPERVFHKQLYFPDFYEDKREELGTAVGIIQDIYTPGAEIVGHYSPSGLGKIAGALTGFMQNLLCIAEDDPQIENGVSLSGCVDAYGIRTVSVQHRYSANDLERRDYLVGKARKVLKAAGGLIPYVYKIDTFSHAVGTLRMGADLSESVLDEEGKFRGVQNLYAVDGSVMPTSGGVNPSLTIVANSLRVSQNIADHRGAGGAL